MPNVQVREHRTVNDKFLVKLTVRAADGAEVKIEPNTVLRDTLHPTTELTLSPKAVALFGRSATMRVVSLPDLFGGKLCAALDRQHPRDLFDVHGLFHAEGITDDIRRAFVVFLASHDRPMSELLTPNRKDLKQVFADQFEGMTLDPVPLAVLEPRSPHPLHVPPPEPRGHRRGVRRGARTGREMKLLKLGTVSIDGTHIRSIASKDKNLTYERAQELRTQLRRDVDTLLAQAE